MTDQQEKIYNNLFNSLQLQTFGGIKDYQLLLSTIREIHKSEPKEATEQGTRIRLFDTVCCKDEPQTPMTVITIMNDVARCVTTEQTIMYYFLNKIEHYTIKCI